MYNISFGKLNKNIPFIFFLLLLYGCNTMEGLGTDIKSAGESLEESAAKSKKCS